MSQRPMKVIRINYHANAPREPSAMIAVLKNPGEVRMSVGNATFMSATKNGLSLSPGWGKNINLQILPQGMTFAGMLIPKPFPLTLGFLLKPSAKRLSFFFFDLVLFFMNRYAF